MKLDVIGCDGSYPAAGGATSGYLVDCEEQGKLLLDCGSGVLARLMHLMDPAELAGIVITHWHNDHASDMLVLRYYLQIAGKKLDVYAPATMQALRSLCVCDEFVMHDIADGSKSHGIHMSSLEVQHPVPAYAVRIECGGKALVYTGDIAAYDETTVDFCRHADLLVCDATFTQAQWREGMPHLSAAQSAQLGAQAAVESLLLTHCPPVNDWQTLLVEGKMAYPQAQFAKPGMRISL